MKHFIFYRHADGYLCELLIENYLEDTSRERFHFKLHDTCSTNNSLVNPDCGMTFTLFLKSLHLWNTSIDALIKCYELWDEYVAFCKANNSIVIDDFLYTLLNMPFKASDNIEISVYNCNNTLQVQKN